MACPNSVRSAVSISANKIRLDSLSLYIQGNQPEARPVGPQARRSSGMINRPRTAAQTADNRWQRMPKAPLHA